MKAFATILILACASALSTGAFSQSKEGPPAWAYPVNPPGLKPPPDDGVPRRVPGSTATFTVTQIRDRFFSPVWHPGDHPPLPEVVASGRKPETAHGVRFRGSYDDGLLVGVCRDASALGFATFMDSRVAILHPTSLWRKQQYRMNSVDVQCYRPTSMDLLSDAARHIATNVQVLIGSVDLTGDHPVFAPVHAVMRAHLGATPYRVRIRLTSERDKQYALILSDTPPSPEPPHD